MDIDSRATLTKDLTDLRGCGRDHLDTLTVYPSHALRMLQVMTCGGRLELVYPSEGLFDLAGLWRFSLFGLRRRFWPRFEWWGKLIAVRLSIGDDVPAAVDLVDSCFASVFGIKGH